MNTILLHPTDILFFKDGRPMSGSLAGHGAAWPLPTVTNAALHAALHRAEINGVHGHDQIRISDGKRQRIGKDGRKFGSLTTVGPFPVHSDGARRTWYFPRPLDAGATDNLQATLLPITGDRAQSSLPPPLQCSVANTVEPSKDPVQPWWSEGAWNAYLGSSPQGNPAASVDFKFDSNFSDTEYAIGIGIDPDTGTQDKKLFYSAHYLRLHEDWRLGLFAEAIDKIGDDPDNKRDLLETLFPNHGAETPVIVGGQQRVCNVLREKNARLPLPAGKTKDFLVSASGKILCKWILLTPAIFPQIGEHPGGWLPSWIELKTGAVMLLDGPGKNYARRHNNATVGQPIEATLVAALVGKPIPVTGYALDNGLENRVPGPKPTLLAVPAGSVYYFECKSQEAATSLAAALNWHGDTPGTAIKNRRSTLMGEKGFGLGVCGTWKFHPCEGP